jgi:glycerol-3-phosphate dehydrogenase (NAD(P)+)
MAIHLASLEHAVFLIPRDVFHAQRMLNSGGNDEFIPGISFPKNLRVTEDFSAIRHCDFIFLGCPSAGVVEFCQRIQRVSWDPLKRRPLIISLCKGFIPETCHLPLQVIGEILPHFSCGVLSGPTYAMDVALGKLTAAVFASRGPLDVLLCVQKILSSNSFRVYISEDAAGVELGGCLKNPYAIGIGLAIAAECGDNGCAALIARMVAEMARIGVALGGNRDTFYGLSGLGDFLATANGRWSRNRMFGERVGRGERPEVVAQSQRSVVEGYHSINCFYKLCRQMGLQTPILDEIYGIIYQGKSYAAAMQKLMNRNLKWED